MEALTLSALQAILLDFETRFGNKPLDTHIFASGNVINALNGLMANYPKRRSTGLEIAFSLHSLLGMEIWHDLTLQPGEIEIGRIEFRDGAPHKVVTKVIRLA